MSKTITIDELAVPFKEGQTIMDAALAAGVYIPHLCHNPEFKPHGSCKLCTVNVNGRNVASCTLPAVEGQQVLSDIEELNADRLALTQMLFVEGNHLCPACEKTGNCQLQAVAYYLGMMSPHYNHFYPQREADASHHDVMLDRNRCIYCELCVRASREVDGKNVFGLSGRGIKTLLVVNSASGLLGDTDLAVTDKAVQVCPTGAILIKRHGYAVPIGQRVFDHITIKDVQTGGGDE
ncbi:MAG: (2Fe-2S)-binding protein [Gammaproteobacteria bacterium]|nr:(2Fe-2S)-binding protein [Gammaproteobacteria bacterium]MBU1978021.1 (2Fe-2S)-binding protein [Gammaproteobacteria bacterium]